jgi:hypothetical protein
LFYLGEEGRPMYPTAKLSNQTSHVNGQIQVPYTLDHDPNKETELLGSLIVAPERFSSVVVRLDPMDFSDELNAATFAAMRACHDLGLVPSGNRILERLDGGLFESQNTTPLAYLSELFMRNDYPGNIPHLVDKVSEVGRRRRLQLALHQARIDLDHNESPASVLADLQGVFQAQRDSLDLVDCGELAGKRITLAPTIFDGLLRRGETANLIMTTKLGKTWMALYLAICIRLGVDAFDRFAVAPGEVLYVNAEIQKETFEHRVQCVVEALGYRMSDLAGLKLIHLKGKMMDLDALLPRLRDYPPGKFAVVFFDPISRMYPKGVKESDPESFGDIYNKIDAFNDHHGCAAIVVHHGTKGSQTNKGVTYVGSGTGMISRAADAHIIGRAHEDPQAVVIDAALRSFKPIEPFCLRWKFSLWVSAPDLDPRLLKSDRPKRRTNDQVPDTTIPFDAEKFASKFLTEIPRKRSVIIAAAQAAGLTERMAGNLLALAEDQSRAHRWKVAGSNAAHYANKEQPTLQNEIA